MGVSTQIIFVFLVIRLSIFEESDKSPKLNFKFEVLFLTFSNNLLEPPYRSSIASTSSPEFNNESTVSAEDNPEANA